MWWFFLLSRFSRNIGRNGHACCLWIMASDCCSVFFNCFWFIFLALSPRADLTTWWGGGGEESQSGWVRGWFLQANVRREESESPAGARGIRKWLIFRSCLNGLWEPMWRSSAPLPASPIKNKLNLTCSMRKLKLRESEQVFKGHTGIEWQNWERDLWLAVQIPDSVLFSVLSHHES